MFNFKNRFEISAGSFVYFSTVMGHKLSNSPDISLQPGETCADYCLTHNSCVGFAQGFHRKCQINRKMQLTGLLRGQKTQLVPDPSSIYFEMRRATGKTFI